MLNRRQAFIGHNKTIKTLLVHHEQQRQLAYIEQMNQLICFFLKHSQIACAWLELFQRFHVISFRNYLQILGFCTCRFQIHSIRLRHIYFIYLLQIITYLGPNLQNCYLQNLQKIKPKGKSQHLTHVDCVLFLKKIFFMQLGHANSMPIQMGLNII